MTTVFDNQLSGPGTHVLAIGIGVYDHLIGGSKTRLDNPYGLGQLDSPPISAKKVAEWFLNDMNNPDAPLSSVESVISSAQPIQIDVPTTTPVTPEPATMANIESAFNAWYSRLDTHEGNVGIFYHCGHGLQSSDLALLAQDFGAPGGNPPQMWSRAYNFDRSYQGMASCDADAQFFFIDACRQVSADVLQYDGRDLATLSSPTLRGRNLNRNAPKLYASAREARAFAQSGDSSRFSNAVLAALASNGTVKHNGTWKVSNESLAAAVIRRIIRGNTNPGVPEQNCVSDGESSSISFIHMLADAPEVPAFVHPSPQIPYSQAATLQFMRNGAASAVAQGPGPWDLEVAAGTYTLRAVDGPTVLNELEDEWVLPPEYERELT